jgi:hypothetical protein
LAAYPQHLSPELHRDRGRGEVVARRVLLVAMVAACILGLANVFGQAPGTWRRTTPIASLQLSAPTALRGGLVFQVRVAVDAHVPMAHPALLLSRGYWEQMTMNEHIPEPDAVVASTDGSVRATYAALKAGDRLIAWFQFQANPAHFGREHLRLALFDGRTRLTEIDRTVIAYP